MLNTIVWMLGLLIAMRVTGFFMTRIILSYLKTKIELNTKEKKKIQWLVYSLVSCIAGLSWAVCFLLLRSQVFAQAIALWWKKISA